VRVGVKDGKAGYRIGKSHEIIKVEECSITHPLVEEILVDGYFGKARKAMIRVSVSTGQRIVVVDKDLPGLKFPSDVRSTTFKELEKGRQLYIREEVNGFAFRVSGGSFFQSRPDAAGVMADIVNEYIKDAPEGDLLDAFCGVGLFGVLCGEGRKVIGVESNDSSVTDAKKNYKKGDIVVRSKFEKWEPSEFTVVVADPARSGLKEAGCEKLVKTNAEIIVLVSCDPAAFARDAGLLTQMGYRLEKSSVVDMFSQTSHIETVSKFIKA
jgi:23S rRNA (uracil1939-C5)-methyltransferase